MLKSAPNRLRGFFWAARKPSKQQALPKYVHVLETDFGNKIAILRTIEHTVQTNIPSISAGWRGPTPLPLFFLKNGNSILY
jgi:hypothetical protein